MKKLGQLFFCILCIWVLPEFLEAKKSTRYPLSVSKNGRYFVQRNGKPFLYHADTAWQMFYKLTREEAIVYMEHRKKQGFNTLQIQITMDVNHPNRYGETPFINANDFNTVCDAYHVRAKEYVHIADSLGFLVVISQPWLGCCFEAYGGKEDKPLRQNGPEKCRKYGEYLGNLFSDCSNVMWIMGGDNNPGADAPAIEAMAEGLRKSAPKFQLITYHASASFSSSDIYPDAEWLGFSMIYSYFREKNGNAEVYEAAHKEYKKKHKMPFVLGESQYEGFSGNDTGTPFHVRRQSYWSLLGGSAGSAYGSSAWCVPENWRKILYYPGADQQKYFIDFFSRIEWSSLIPDLDNQVVIHEGERYGDVDYIVSAVSENRDLAVCYLSRGKAVKCNLERMKSGLTAYWYNPRNGKYIKIGKQKNKICSFKAPDENDWVLFFSKKSMGQEKNCF